MISILTPKRATDVYSCDVTAQTVPCVRYSHSTGLPNMRDDEAVNRNELKQYASTPYTVLMDCDVVLTDPTTLEQMVKFLDDYSDVPAVAVDTKGQDDDSLARACDIGHTVIALIMIRKPILDMIVFSHIKAFNKYGDDFRQRACIRTPEIKKGLCGCMAVNRQIRSFTGWPVPYLRGVRATEKK